MASICWLLLPACHPATLGVGGDTIAERDDTKSTRVTADKRVDTKMTRVPQNCYQRVQKQLLTLSLITDYRRTWKDSKGHLIFRRKATPPYRRKDATDKLIHGLLCLLYFVQDSNTMLPSTSRFLHSAPTAVAERRWRTLDILSTTSPNDLNLRTWLTGSWICFLQAGTSQALLPLGTTKGTQCSEVW